MRRILRQLEITNVEAVKILLNEALGQVRVQAHRLDGLLDRYKTLQGSQEHSTAAALREQIITSDQGLAAASVLHLGRACAQCETMNQQFQRGSTSAQRNVMLDQIRDDHGKLRSLHTDLHALVHASSTKNPRKRAHAESGFNPDGSPEDRSVVNPPKRLRQISSSRPPVPIVLDLCSDSDPQPLTLMTSTKHRAELEDNPINPRKEHPTALMPLAFANAARPRPRGRPRKTKMPALDDPPMEKGSVTEPAPTSASHQSSPTARKCPKLRIGSLPVELASAILRAAGRHPYLPSLNSDVEDIIPRKKIRVTTKIGGDSEVAKEQHQFMMGASMWWRHAGVNTRADELDEWH